MQAKRAAEGWPSPDGVVTVNPGYLEDFDKSVMGKLCTDSGVAEAPRPPAA